MAHLNDMAKEIYLGNVSRGFWEKKREIGTLLMLVTSELSEALEADRKDHHCVADLRNCFPDSGFDKEFFEKNVKDTFEDEIADAIIRLLDLCGHMNINIDDHIKAKLHYNATRGYKHGKRY